MHNKRVDIFQNVIGLVALDLDGTIMGHDLRISDRVHQVVRAVQQRDVVVTLATGRMFSAALPFAQLLAITAPLICYQGGWIQAPDGGVLRREILPPALVQSVLEVAQNRSWHTVVYVDGMIMMEEKRYPQIFYTQLIGPDVVVQPDLAAVLQNQPADKMLFVAEPEEILNIARFLVPRFGKMAEVFQSHRMLIELVPKSVNKGQALTWLAAHLQVPRQAVLAIGDQENDIPMIEWAGVGIAMGNAAPAVQQVADWTAPTLEQEGAAVALERFVLREGVP